MASISVNDFWLCRCVIRGCVPKKILVYGASLGGEIEVIYYFYCDLPYIIFSVHVKVEIVNSLVYFFSFLLPRCE